jgi:hypothetical protein
MIEDKLDKDQRIRLEALAQANTSNIMAADRTGVATIDVAKRFETYIRIGKNYG